MGLLLNQPVGMCLENHLVRHLCGNIFNTTENFSPNMTKTLLHTETNLRACRHALSSTKILLRVAKFTKAEPRYCYSERSFGCGCFHVPLSQESRPRLAGNFINNLSTIKYTSATHTKSFQSACFNGALHSTHSQIC